LFFAVNAYFMAGLNLAAHVDFRRWIVADEHDGKSGTNA